jgi:hypothetical protein
MLDTRTIEHSNELMTAPPQERFKKTALSTAC